MLSSGIINFTTYATRKNFLQIEKFPAFFRANRTSKVGISILANRRKVFNNRDRVTKHINTSCLNQFINNLCSAFKVELVSNTSFFRAIVNVFGQREFHV